MNYRRVFLPGGTFFFTLVTYQRRPILSTPDEVDLLRNEFRYTMKQMPFTVVASVILPEPVHFIWTLPPGSSDYSTRWRLIKSHFTRNWCPKESVSETASRVQKGEKDIWQRRFCEYLIRVEIDLTRHGEYIHYNPVKHGLVNSPGDWEYSSFMKYGRDVTPRRSRTPVSSAEPLWGSLLSCITTFMSLLSLAARHKCRVTRPRFSSYGDERAKLKKPLFRDGFTQVPPRGFEPRFWP